MQTHYPRILTFTSISVTYTGCEQTEKLMLTFLWLASRFFQQIRLLLGKLTKQCWENIFSSLWTLCSEVIHSEGQANETTHW